MKQSYKNYCIRKNLVPYEVQEEVHNNNSNWAILRVSDSESILGMAEANI